MHRATGECIRHAPGVTTVKNQRAKWPTTHENRRCGAGSTVEEPVKCSQCIHWDTREPISQEGRGNRDNPFARSRVSIDEKSCNDLHYCAKGSPYPGASTYAAEWLVTHADEACGDGTAF
jgi:uncharacterized protein (UPF0179 family)